MKAVGLTDLVPAFDGEFHQQLLGIGADEDEWGGRLVAGLGELRRSDRGKTGLTSAQPCCVQNAFHPHGAKASLMNHSASARV